MKGRRFVSFDDSNLIPCSPPNPLSLLNSTIVAVFIGAFTGENYIDGRCILLLHIAKAVHFFCCAENTTFR